MSRQAITAEQAADRFGMPEEWGRYHQAWHICVDGRNYSGRSTCLVTDPELERVARYFMTRNAPSQGGPNA